MVTHDSADGYGGRNTVWQVKPAGRCCRAGWYGIVWDTQKTRNKPYWAAYAWGMFNLWPNRSHASPMPYLLLYRFLSHM